MEPSKLLSNADARDWAKEFKRQNPAADEDSMLAWFANSIMCGYDDATGRHDKTIAILRECEKIIQAPDSTADQIAVAKRTKYGLLERAPLETVELVDRRLLDSPPDVQIDIPQQLDSAPIEGDTPIDFTRMEEKLQFHTITVPHAEVMAAGVEAISARHAKSGKLDLGTPPAVDIDSIALDAATKIMALRLGDQTSQYEVRLKAHIQCIVHDALDSYRPGAPDNTKDEAAQPLDQVTRNRMARQRLDNLARLQGCDFATGPDETHITKLRAEMGYSVLDALKLGAGIYEEGQIKGVHIPGAVWPDPAKMPPFTTERRNDPHNLSNQHDDKKRRRTDRDED